MGNTILARDEDGGLSGGKCFFFPPPDGSDVEVGEVNALASPSGLSSGLPAANKFQSDYAVLTLTWGL